MILSYPDAGQWQPLVDEFFHSETGRDLLSFLRQRKAAGIDILPEDPFRALRLTPPQSVRVVILGQDPYHGPGQANGLAFAVGNGVKIPPSLRNIYKELSREFDRPAPLSGDLSSWAEQGVLLLNAVLTVEAGNAGSHAKKGWEVLTDQILVKTASLPGSRVYLLWGGWAQKKELLITTNSHDPYLILKANHPSPLSALRPPIPFIGCGHFRLANDWLCEHGHNPINWFSPSDPSLL